MLYTPFLRNEKKRVKKGGFSKTLAVGSTGPKRGGSGMRGGFLKKSIFLKSLLFKFQEVQELLFNLD